MKPPPFHLRVRDFEAPSLFRPENMLRESRRQKGLSAAMVPSVCLLDPDGDIVRHVLATGRGEPATEWACFHSELVTFDAVRQATGLDGRIGVVGKTVGASYAVMVAEQLFASGCRFLISLSSAGQIADIEQPPYFVLIDRALRDEGTSAHYLPPEDEVDGDPLLIDAAWSAIRQTGMPIHRGGSWTTDAPFRETAEAVARAQSRNALVVEMEAAGLYAFARACNRDVLCLAHVTNRLGRPGDFEKGADEGTTGSLRLVEELRLAWWQLNRERAALLFQGMPSAG